MKDLLTMFFVSVFGVLLALSAAHASTIRLNSSSTDPIDSNVGIDSAVGIFFIDYLIMVSQIIFWLIYEHILSYKGC